MAVVKIATRSHGGGPGINIWSGLVADPRPAATVSGGLVAGDLYIVTDGTATERWNGRAWEAGAGAGSEYTWDFAAPVNRSLTTSAQDTAVLDAVSDIVVLLSSDTDAYIAQGTSPTAGTSDWRLAADVYIPVVIAAGNLISARAVTGTGTLQVLKQE